MTHEDTKAQSGEYHGGLKICQNPLRLRVFALKLYPL